ncbi:MAG: hypothetical protein JST39_15400 [Bacteroidetes bacterium]|nr:hypothetical protein [Bacteroidota bacterium]
MKAIYSLLLLTLFYTCSRAQRSWELRIGGGYGFSTASQILLNGYNYYSSSTNWSSNTWTVNSSLGRAVQANADITWWLHRYLGVTVGAGWQSTPSAIKGTSNSIGIDFGSSTTEKWESKAMMAMAGIALKIPDTKLQPYMRMGLLLPVYSRLVNSAEVTSSSMIGVSHGSSERIFRLRNTAGYSAAIGISPSAGKHLRLFAEISLQSLAPLAKHSELTRSVVNDVDQMPMMTTNIKEIDYVKKMDNNTYDPNKPSQEPTFSLPYSSIGLRAGVSFKL